MLEGEAPAGSPAVASRLKRSPFTAWQIAEFGRRAEELNARGEGDQACFFLERR
jgi:hypothetical protein